MVRHSFPTTKLFPILFFIFFYDRPSSCVMARIDSTIRPPAVGIQTDGFTSVQCRRGTRFKNDRYKEKQLILISPNLSIFFFLLRLIIWIGSDKQDRRVLPFFYSHSGSVFNWSTVNKRLSWYPCDVFLKDSITHPSPSVTITTKDSVIPERKKRKEREKKSCFVCRSNTFPTLIGITRVHSCDG